MLASHVRYIFLMIKTHYKGILLLCLACFVASCAPKEDVGNPFRAQALRDWPEMRVTDAEGAPAALPTGQWHVVNLWATWCTPCIKEMPDLDKLAAELKPYGVVVSVIAVNTPREAGHKMLEKLGVQHVHAFYDSDHTVMPALKPRGIPTTYWVSPEGQIVGMAEGDKGWATPDTLAWFRSTLQRVGTGVSPE